MAEDKFTGPLHVVSDGHEERLQRVEHTQHELAVKVAENNQQINFVGTELERGFGRMAEKIEQCIKPLADKMVEQNGHIEAMGDRIGEHGKALERFKDAERRSAERWDWWKKAMATVITGAAAIALKELVAFIAHRL